MKIIKGIKIQGTSPKKFAAMYYKTEPFVSGIGSYQHTNNWEILKACEIIASKGYEIDLIDRNNKNWLPDKQYDLFLGLGVGDSGEQFVKYANSSKAKKRVLLAMGPQPDISNKRVLERYQMFNERTGRNAPPTRTVEKVTGKKFNEIIDNTDYIFCIGEEGTESHNSFLKYNKPILSFYPAVSNKVIFDDLWISMRKRNHYLCFVGNGLICKGVDLIIEAFKEINDAVLHICGPNEEDFIKEYGTYINKSNRIFYHGFIEVGGTFFNKLASECSYVINYSSAESCCTSVATSMKAGLVPVINPWTSITIKDNFNGITIEDDGCFITNIIDKIKYSSSINKKEYEQLVINNNQRAKNFSQKGFELSYNECIEKIIND